MPLAFDQIIARLEELRVECERDGFSAVAHQLEAWIGYLTMRPGTFSRPDAGAYEPPAPSEEG